MLRALRMRRSYLSTDRNEIMDLSYTLIKSKRKTISLEMKPDGSLIVRAPNRTTKSEADAFVKKHEIGRASCRERV